MGDLFSNRKQSVCDKSLLRVRGIEAVQAEIKETEEAVLQCKKMFPVDFSTRFISISLIFIYER